MAVSAFGARQPYADNAYWAAASGGVASGKLLNHSPAARWVQSIVLFNYDTNALKLRIKQTDASNADFNWWQVDIPAGDPTYGVFVDIVPLLPEALQDGFPIPAGWAVSGVILDTITDGVAIQIAGIGYYL